MEKDRGSIGKKIQGWGKMLIPSLKDTNTISTPKLNPIHATFDNKVTWHVSSTLNKGTTYVGNRRETAKYTKSWKMCQDVKLTLSPKPCQQYQW